MEIQCACGTLRVRLAAIPAHTPGRLVCYCDDCQTYLRHLGRADLLDANGGTEVVPTYPTDVSFLAGQEQLRCLRLSPRGTYRFYAACCQTPVANTRPDRPWAGFVRAMFTGGGRGPAFEALLGPVKSRIMGRYAHGTPPEGTAQTFNAKAVATVLPFLIKGRLTGRAKPSPFFLADGHTPIVEPKVLTLAERRAAQP